jgi:hypothetical protein
MLSAIRKKSRCEYSRRATFGFGVAQRQTRHCAASGKNRDEMMAGTYFSALHVVVQVTLTQAGYVGLRPVAQIQFFPGRCLVATSANPAWVKRSRCSASLRNAARRSGITIP